MILTHNFLVLTWVAEVVDAPGQMKRSPAGDGHQEDFHHKGPGDVAGVEVASE